MNMPDFVAKVAEKGNLPSNAKARALIDLVAESIKEVVKAGDEIRIPDFGVFKPATRAARTGINPQNGEKLEIAEKTRCTFKQSRNFWA